MIFISVINLTIKKKWFGNNKETMSDVSWAHCKSNTIYAANVSKTLSRHRPTTAPQERSRRLSKSSFFLFVSFQLCNEQLQKGIRTNFKQGQIKVHSSKLHSILSKGSVFHSHNSSFPIFLNISNMSLFFFFSLSLPCSLSLFLCLFSLLFAQVWFAPRASGWDIVLGVMVCDLSFLHSYSSTPIMPSTEWVTVYVWDYMRLLSLYCMTSPICLHIGVQGHADPSGGCEFPGYPEWPYPWKAL